MQMKIVLLPLSPVYALRDRGTKGGWVSNYIRVRANINMSFFHFDKRIRISIVL